MQIILNNRKSIESEFRGGFSSACAAITCMLGHAFSQVRRRPTFDQFVAAGGGGSFAFPSFGDRYIRLWKFSGCDSGCTMHEKELFDIRVLSTEIEDEY